LKAVLFDLDDTLFDHQYSRRRGLELLQAVYPRLGAVPIPELEIEHEKILLSSYYQTLDGVVTLEESRISRIRLLGERYGLNIGPDEAGQVARDYHRIYEMERRAVPGASELLKFLAEKGLKIGVVTNGLADAQQEKLRVCSLDHDIDFMLVSEVIGIRKPSPGIFMEALRLANAGPEETIYIGDAWGTDIMGAFRSGMRTIWLNRYGLPCPEPGIAIEINSFIPLEYLIDCFPAGFLENFD
jgi:HAD superfamily hydrolase (TIGR01662 family)